MIGGISKANYYERIISLIDANELNKILFDFFKTLTKKLNHFINLRNFDGCVNNGSKRNNTILNNDKKTLDLLRK